MHKNPSSPVSIYLGAITIGAAATTCWFIHRELREARRLSVIAPDAEAALRRINLRLVGGGK